VSRPEGWQQEKTAASGGFFSPRFLCWSLTLGMLVLYPARAEKLSPEIVSISVDKTLNPPETGAGVDVMK